MTQSTYDVSFSGVLAEGVDLSQVKKNVAKLFKTDIQKIEVMFSGKRVVIKRDLDQQTAMKYLMAMKNIGAICNITEKKPEAIIEESQQYSAENPPPIPPPESKASQQQSARTSPIKDIAAETILKQKENSEAAETSVQEVSLGDLTSVTIAPPGETIIEHEPIEEAEIDISAISFDESKSDLVEHTRVPEPNIDISSMSMDNSGDDLVQHEKIVEPEFDISAINMDETGVDLTTHKEVPPLKVDISNISLAPTGTRILEK